VEIISRIVADLKRKCNEDIWIAPSTEYLNRILIENRDYFEKMGCVIPLSNKEIYETVSDKQKFAKECSKYGIKSPDTVEDASLFVMPMVAKPNKYISSDGKIYSPIFILGKESHSRFMETHQKSDFTFQQFLDGGESLYLLFYFAGNGRSWTYSQKNIAQQKGGKSIVAAVGAQYHLSDELVSPYVRMFKEMGFYGLVMVEVRIYDGENYMIEANPRFWGPSQLFCDAGNNFFECMLADYGFLKDEPDFKNDAAYYFWSGGIDMRELNLNKTHKNRMDTGFIRGGYTAYSAQLFVA
jgi:predicted ATP-grasp superfamily ATP-dependent carboligase